MLWRADVLLFGRTTYEMMEAGWREPSEQMPDWTKPFAKTIGAKKKYVVSSTLKSVDWNAELVRDGLRRPRARFSLPAVRAGISIGKACR